MKTNKPFPIFSAGRHTDRNGIEVSFTEADLKASAEAYDPQLHEAPLVVGHPAIDAPAYGWVESLAVSAGKLVALPKQVEHQFAEVVNAGRYKKVSASFYPPTHPSNPKPGVYYLRHVGFLGAHAPALKGLGTVSFGEEDAGIVTVEFGEVPGWMFGSLGAFARRMREWLIADKGLETADSVLPTYLVSDIESMAAKADEMPAAPALAYSEEETPLTTPNEQVLAQREADIKAREDALHKREAEARNRGHMDFAEVLVNEGRILPAQKDGLAAFLGTLPADAIVEFGEGNTKTSTPGEAWLKSFLQGLPKVVEFGEVATGDTNPKTVDFAAPAGFAVDSERSELHQKALVYQSTNGGDYVTAYKAVGGR